MSGKFALIIGNTQYTDPGLAQLTAPGKDADDFARVLRDTDICEFDEVKTLLNQISSTVIEAIDEFFDQKKPDDLLVLYFSGHGVRDELGSLYLAVKNTIRTRLRSTAIKSDYIREVMDQSRSKRQVLIMDCCNSGAIAQGTKAAIGVSIGTAAAFEAGYGRIILTASDSTQFAWEGDKVVGETDNSLFTHYLIEGLEGEADFDGDGRITVDDVYDYAYEKVKLATPKQTPSKFSSKQQGEIVLRQNMRIEDIKPAALPSALLDSLENPFSDVRLGVVQQLIKLLNGKNLGLARSAREALERIAEEDDSRTVSRAAIQAVKAIRQAEQLELQTAEEERLAAEKVEAETKADEERRAKKEAKRLAALKAKEERLARERAEVEYRSKQEAERLLAEQKAEAEQIRVQKAKEERLAREKAESEQKAKETAERLLAKQKIETERKAKEDAEQRTKEKRRTTWEERLAREKAEADRLAKQKVEEEREAREEAERLAYEKARAEHQARAEAKLKAKQEVERLAAKREKEERLAAEKAETDRKAREKRLVAEKAVLKTPQPALVTRNIFISIGLFITIGLILVLQVNAAQRAKAIATAQAQATNSANAEATRTEIAGSTSTAIARSTSTAIARSTNTAIARSTSTGIAVATVQSINEFVATLDAASQLVFGPEEGGLVHAADGYIATYSAGVDLRDFIVMTTFLNPYSTTTGSWDYGFLFRDEYGNAQYRLAIYSDTTWELANHIESSDYSIIHEGQLSNLDTSENGSNTVLIYCQGDKGILYVNGEFIAELDLSARLNSGDVGIGTGFQSGDEIDGYSTNYEEFNVWEIP